MRCKLENYKYWSQKSVFYIFQRLAAPWYGRSKKCFMFIYLDKVKKKKTTTLYIKNMRLLSYSSPWKGQNWINFKVNLILHKYASSRYKDLTLMRWRMRCDANTIYFYPVNNNKNNMMKIYWKRKWNVLLVTAKSH